MALRALGRRVAKLEVAGKPRPTPFSIMYGSLDGFIDRVVMPGIAAGLLSVPEMVDIVAALRSWHTDGHYAAWEHERTWQR